MPKPGEYTRSRRIAMQFTLWCVLAAALGAAALVDRQLDKPPVLGDAIDLPPLHFRLPAGWNVTNGTTDDPRIVAIARETGGEGRELTVFSQRIRRRMNAADYLNQTGIAEEVFGMTPPDAENLGLMGGIPSIRARGETSVQTDSGTQIVGQMLDCAIFPNGCAVTLWLSKPGTFNVFDQDLLTQVARAVKMDGLTSP